MQKHVVWLVSLLLVACTLPNALGTQPTALPTEVVAPTATAALPQVTVDPIEWGTCTDDAVDAEDRDVYQCGTVTVPLDYAHPDGEKINIALVRIPASGTRIGAILYNPGGPGGSGFEYVAMAGQRYIDTLGLESYDFVGFDPRGVDRSGGIRCQSDSDTDKYLYPDTTPDTPAEEAFLEESRYAFAKACKATYGDTLQHYSTANTARDMDMIRQAMGDTTISYLGVSYGTYLGAVYASMFPDHVRAMVLDSAYQPDGDSIEEQYMTQLQGFALAMQNWIAWCEKETICAFRADDVGVRWDALYAQFDTNPLTATDGRVANQVVIERATISALYSESQWPTLGQALANAEKGDTRGVWKLADEYYQRNTDGTYPTMQQSNNVIDCASDLTYDTVSAQDAPILHQKMVAASPHFTHDLLVSDLQTPSSCTEYMTVLPAPTIRYAGSAPILIVAGENDPATPLRWGIKMRESLGNTARLVTYTGEGHGQVLSAKCVSDYASDVLVHGTLPADDVRCEPDPAVVQPTWWGELPQPPDATAMNQAVVSSALGFSDSEAYVQAWAVADATADQLLKTYGFEFEKMGYLKASKERDISGAKFQYFGTDKNYVGVLVIDSVALQHEDWASVQLSVPTGDAVLVYIYFPE